MASCGFKAIWGVEILVVASGAEQDPAQKNMRSGMPLCAPLLPASHRWILAKTGKMLWSMLGLLIPLV